MPAPAPSARGRIPRSPPERAAPPRQALDVRPLCRADPTAVPADPRSNGSRSSTDLGRRPSGCRGPAAAIRGWPRAARRAERPAAPSEEGASARARRFRRRKDLHEPVDRSRRRPRRRRRPDSFPRGAGPGDRNRGRSSRRALRGSPPAARRASLPGRSRRASAGIQQAPAAAPPSPRACSPGRRRRDSASGTRASRRTARSDPRTSSNEPARGSRRRKNRGPRAAERERTVSKRVVREIYPSVFDRLHDA